MATGTIVSEEWAQQLAKAMRAEGYLKCSTKKNIDSIHKLFKVLSITSIGYMFHIASEFEWRRSSGTSGDPKKTGPISQEYDYLWDIVLDLIYSTMSGI
jgi:hypothetical protein